MRSHTKPRLKTQAYHLQHHPPRRDGIGLGVVVVEVDAEVGGEGAELMVWQAGPGLAGIPQGALVLEEWSRHLKMLQQGMQHAQVKGGIVRDDEVSGG